MNWQFVIMIGAIFCIGLPFAYLVTKLLGGGDGVMVKTIMISIEDKLLIERLRRRRKNPKRGQNKRETAGDVIHRALDLLEEERKKEVTE